MIQWNGFPISEYVWKCECPVQFENTRWVSCATTHSKLTSGPWQFMNDPKFCRELREQTTVTPVFVNINASPMWKTWIFSYPTFINYYLPQQWLETKEISDQIHRVTDIYNPWSTSDCWQGGVGVIWAISSTITTKTLPNLETEHDRVNKPAKRRLFLKSYFQVHAYFTLKGCWYLRKHVSCRCGSDAMLWWFNVTFRKHDIFTDVGWCWRFGVLKNVSACNNYSFLLRYS